MGPIGTISGLASGIQWRDMVDEIVAVDRLRQVTPLENQRTAHHRSIDAWAQVRTMYSKFQSAATALRDGSAFGAFSVTAGTTGSGRAVLTATAGESAAPGTYTVEVLALAKAEKLGSAAHVSTTEPLGLVGSTGPDSEPLPLQFTINGVAIEVAQDATLNQVRDAINQANTGASPTGVSATILTTGPGEHRLILTAERTGTAGIRLTDGPDGALSQLGLSTHSQSASFVGAMDTPPTSLATVLGLSSPPAVRTIVVDGQEVQVDLTTDTLSTLLDKIRAAALAAGRDPMDAAEIVEQGDGSHRLVVQGTVVGKWNDADTQATLDALGFSRENLISAGSDAQVAIDGYAFTRSTNTISDALDGITLNLQQAEVGSPIEVKVARNTDAAIGAVRSLVNAYNELVEFTHQATAPGGPLARNVTLKTTVSSIRGAFLTELESTPEQTFTFSRTTLLGVSLTRSGTLEIDESRLRAALESNPEDVKQFFTGFEGGPQGLGERLVGMAEMVTRSGDGLVAGQTESLERSIDRLDMRISNAEARLVVRYEMLITQFTRMEEALQRFQSQSSWLTSQIEALPRARGER